MDKEGVSEWFGNNHTRKRVKGEFRGKARKAVERGIWLQYVKPKRVEPDGHGLTRGELDEAVERFLRDGGQITQVAREVIQLAKKGKGKGKGGGKGKGKGC